MRTIVAGSRTVTDYATVEQAIKDCPWVISKIISGHAKGVDKLGELYAKAHKIPLEIYPAQWEIYGNRAGYVRNEHMASKADTLIAIWDGVSTGTGHMIDIARSMGLKIFIVYAN